LLFGVVLAYAYGRLKVGKHPGLASHWLYWYTGAPQPKELPPSHLRELNG
jgi:conjugal transfer pilus assembly protein TraL